MSTLRDKAIGGFSWNFIQQLGNAGVQFSVQIILSYIIAPEELAIFAIIYFFYIISNVISDSGMGESIIRSDNPDERDYGTIFTTNLGVSIALYLFIMLLSPFVANFYDEPSIPKLLSVYCLSIVLTSFSSIQVFRLSRNLDFKKQALIQIPSVLIGGIVGVVLGYLGYGIWSLVFMTLSKELLLSIQYWLFTGWRPKLMFDKQKFKSHFDFGYKLSLSTLLNSLSSNLVPLIITSFFTKTITGYYVKASDMVNFPMSTMTSVLGKVSYPLLNQVKSDQEQIKKTFKSIQAAAIYIIGMVMFLFIVTAKYLIPFLIGETWLSSIPYFQLLCLSSLLYPVNMYNLNILKVFGKSDQYLKANLITKTAFLIGIFVAVRFGVIPMIICIIILNIFSFIVNVSYCTKYIEYSIINQTRDILKSLTPAVISCVVSYFFSLIFDFGILINLIILSTIYLTIFLTASDLLKNNSYLDIKNIVQSRFKKRK